MTLFTSYFHMSTLLFFRNIETRGMKNRYFAGIGEELNDETEGRKTRKTEQLEEISSLKQGIISKDLSAQKYKNARW